MKLLAFLLLAFIATVFANTEYENAVNCGRKSPATNQAISAFCNRRGPKGKLLNNIVAPSPYSRNGKAATSGGVTIVASITGTCAPAQWVPITYCKFILDSGEMASLSSLLEMFMLL